MHSQAPEVFIRCQSFVPLDPLVINVVDECGNVIQNWKGKVLLDFKGSGASRGAVVSSRKAAGLPAEQVLQFEKVDVGGMQLLGLTVKELGSYSASFRSMGLPDVPVWFEVSAGNVVTSLDLSLDDAVNPSNLPLGVRLCATLQIDTADGATLTHIDKTALSCQRSEKSAPVLCWRRWSLYFCTGGLMHCDHVQLWWNHATSSTCASGNSRRGPCESSC